MRKLSVVLTTLVLASWTVFVPARGDVVRAAGPDPASAVNPFVGTSGSVDDFPGADAPFGMVKWSPDTYSRPAGGGYEYNDSEITGFSLDHISGPGCGAGGDVPILPWVGSIPSTPFAGPGSLVQPFPTPQNRHHRATIPSPSTTQHPEGTRHPPVSRPSSR